MTRIPDALVAANGNEHAPFATLFGPPELPPPDPTRDEAIRLLQLALDNGLASYELPHLIADLQALHTQSAGSDLPDFQRMDLLGTDCEYTWLIENHVVAGAPLLIAAPMKAFKTLFAIEMGVSLASGTPFLGMAAVPEARNVVLMSGEADRSTMRANISRVCAAHNVEMANVLNRLAVYGRVPRLDRPDHLQAVAQVIETDQPTILFIDPLYFAIPGKDAGNLMVQGDYLRQIAELCNSRGVTLAIVHHVTRTAARESGPPKLVDVSWSGAPEFAAQWVLLSHREPFDAEHGNAKLWVEIGGRAGQKASWAVDIHEGRLPHRVWQTVVRTASAGRQAAVVSRHVALADQRRQERSTAEQQGAQAIVRFLAEQPRHEETRNAMLEQGIVGRTHLDRALALALQSEWIVEASITKSNRTQPYPGYRLTEAGEQRAAQAVSQAGQETTGSNASHESVTPQRYLPADHSPHSGGMDAG